MRDIGPADAIAWDDSEPRPQPKKIPIIRAQAKASIELVLLDCEIVGVWVHNIDRRDTPCLGSKCPHRAARHHLDARRKLYHACWDPMHCRLCLGEFTPDALATWQTEGDHGVVPSRGVLLVLSRRGSYAQAPVVIEYRSGEIPEEELPPPFDIKAALMRQWMADSRPSDQFGFPVDPPNKPDRLASG